MENVSKTVLVLKPRFNVAANRCAMRTLLIDSGFVIVREEGRLLVGDTKRAILGNHGEDAECAIYVVSREDSVATLRQLLDENSLCAPGSAESADVFAPASAEAAAATLTLLFPRMKRDAIPSQEHSAEYLERELKMLLVKGLTDLAKKKPEKPVEALAEWLLENNPHRSAAVLPAPAAAKK